MRCHLLFVAVALASPIAAQARITGSVVDHLRDPAAAAEVWVEQAGAVVARGTTDGSGMFVFANVPYGRVDVRATIPGHTVGFDYCTTGAADPRAAVDLRMHEAACLRGRVVDEHGEPIAGAWLQTENDVSFDWYIPEFRLDARANEYGAFEIDKVLLGSTTLRAWADGRQVFEQRLDVRGDEHVDVVLRPADGQCVTVRIAGLDEAVRAGARVRVSYSRDGSGCGMPGPLMDAPVPAGDVVQLEGLPMDVAVQRIWLELPPGSASDPVTHRLEAPVGDPERRREVAFSVAALSPVEVRGVVRDTSGAPAPGVELLMHRSSVAPDAVVRTAPDGSYAFETVPHRWSGFSLLCTSNAQALRRAGQPCDELFATGVVSGSTDRDRELDLVVAPAAPLRVRIVDRDGRPAPGVPLTLRRHTKRYGGVRATTEADGEATFARVDTGAVGAFVVTTEGPRGFVRSEPFELHEQDLPSSVRTLVLTPAATIGGVVRDANGAPVPGAPLSLRRFDPETRRLVDGFLIEAVADRQGRFRFVGLEPRGWRLLYGLRDATTDAPGDWFDPGPGERIDTELRLEGR